ncbi:hypothetical protein LXA43DRAFT_1058946 [Ganoderma leucocontextum]|nr:hypothetical protein LXA43DRAFT_1058946 [Ganoderma leucocontextum]
MREGKGLGMLRTALVGGQQTQRIAAVRISSGRGTRSFGSIGEARFKSKVPGSLPPFDKWPTTLRRPKHDQSDPDAFARTLSNTPDWSLTSEVYFTLTLLNTWTKFSNSRADSEDILSVTSLERLHDYVHGWIGGAGHMGDVSMAAFDPIFYLHHANVDRLLSLWSALHPDLWVSEDRQGDGGTFSLPHNATIDADTPLFPFARSQDTYWTSRDAIGTTHMGYTYPEFDGLDMTNVLAVQKHIKDVVEGLYAPHGTNPTTSADNSDESSVQSTWKWSARVRVQRFQLERSFQVLVFLGSVPEDPSEWVGAPSFVGAFGAFVNGTAAQCANCQVLVDVVTEGCVHLNRALFRNYDVRTFNPEDVSPRLKDHLDWRIQMVDGTPVRVEKLPSLEVTVVAVQLAMRVIGEVLPVQVGEAVVHRDITSGRLGGAHPE